MFPRESITHVVDFNSMSMLGRSPLHSGYPSFAAVLTGLLTAFAGVHQLRAIAKANYLQAFESFAQRWEESKDDRWRVLESFTFDLSNPPSSDSDESQVLRRVVNSVNIAGLLVEQKLVPAQAILTLCYPDFIRLEKVLDGYLKYRSKQLGIKLWSANQANV